MSFPSTRAVEVPWSTIAGSLCPTPLPVRRLYIAQFPGCAPASLIRMPEPNAVFTTLLSAPDLRTNSSAIPAESSPPLPAARTVVACNAHPIRGIPGVHAVYDNVVFPIQVGNVIRDDDVVTVFHVNRILAVTTALIAVDFSVCRVPNGNPVFSSRSQFVANNLEVLDAAGKINSPAFETPREGNQAICENAEIGNASCPDIGVNRGRGTTIWYGRIDLDLAVAQGDVPYGSRPHVNA